MITDHALQRAVQRNIVKNRYLADMLLRKVEKYIQENKDNINVKRVRRSEDLYYYYYQHKQDHKTSMVGFWVLYNNELNSMITVIRHDPDLHYEWKVEQLQQRCDRQAQHISVLLPQITKLKKENKHLRRWSLLSGWWALKRLFIRITQRNSETSNIPPVDGVSDE